MQKTVSRLIAITMLLAAAAAAKNPPVHSMIVQSDWLAQHLNDKNIVVLHVGVDRKSYEQGHIPGARFLPLASIAVTRNGVPNEMPAAAELTQAFERAGVGNHSRVVLYGDELGLLAARAWFTLQYLGKNSVLLDGGLERWKAERREVTATVPPAPQPVNLTAKLRPELLIEMPAVQQIVQQKDVAILDARPPEQYSGAVPGDGVRRGGHIPGAKNVFWMDNLVSKQDPVLKSLDQIRARYQSAGLKRGSKVVVYCRTGVQAAHDYLTLKLVGFQPVLYDGSFLEWNLQPGNEVEKSGVAGR